MEQDGEVQTTSVRSAHLFDVEALERYLVREVPSYRGPLEVRQFGHGQSNPTFMLQTPTKKYVMRKKPPGKLLPSAHAIDREFRILSALHKRTPVPVPAPICLCEDDSVIGQAFYIMEMVEGRVFRSPLLKTCSPLERAAIYDSMAKTLADLHSVDFEAVGLSDFGRSKDYLKRQVARWTKQYELSKTSEIPEMDALATWLRDHVPCDQEVTIVHGDFKLDNLIFHPTEPRVIAVLDWELSTLGHPLSDVAYSQLAWMEPSMGFPVAFSFAGTGIPTQAAFQDCYFHHRGLSAPSDMHFYHAFSLFRIASILQGVYMRAELGNASSESAKATGAMAKLMAKRGWAIVCEKDTSAKHLTSRL